MRRSRRFVPILDADCRKKKNVSVKHVFEKTKKISPHFVFCRDKNRIENACGRKRAAGILWNVMSNEEKSTVFPALNRLTAAIFGIGALASVACSAIFGYNNPFLGCVLLAACVLVSILAFIFGVCVESAFARKLSYLSVGLAVLVTFAALALLFFDKNFENRCVDAWQNLTQKTERIERRLEQLEDRFDRD